VELDQAGALGGQVVGDLGGHRGLGALAG
jgi:hypothetical protein